MSTNFKGDWSGYGEGQSVGGMHVRIEEHNHRLKVYALTRSFDGEVEVIELDGDIESDTKANLELVNYVSDNPESLPPRNAHVVLVAKPDIEQLEGQFVTDVETHGTVRLRKATRWGKCLLGIPFIFHKLYRYIKRFVYKRFRHGYLLLVVSLAILSVAGKFPEKLSTTEALVLLAPLIFLFSNNIRQLIEAMAVRKLGPVEFQDQAKPSPKLSIPQMACPRFHVQIDKVV